MVRVYVYRGRVLVKVEEIISDCGEGQLEE